MTDDRGRHLDSLAKIHPSVVVGDGTAIWAFASVHDGVSVGQQCSIGELTYVGRYTTIGDGTRISTQCHITDRMRIGRNVFIGPMVTTVNDRHPRVGNIHYTVEPPIIEDDVSIGGNATILPGVRLGKGCVIGAGAVVTKDVPPHQTWVGNPARRLATLTARDLASHESYCRLRDGDACNCHPAFIPAA